MENIFYLQGQEQVHCTGKRNYHTGAGSEILFPVWTPCYREHISAVPQERPRAGTFERKDTGAWNRGRRDKKDKGCSAGQDAEKRERIKTMTGVRELTTNRRIIDARKQRDDVKVCITLAIPGETEKTEITHTKKAISVSAPKISLEFDKLSRQS